MAKSAHLSNCCSLLMAIKETHSSHSWKSFILRFVLNSVLKRVKNVHTFSRKYEIFDFVGRFFCQCYILKSLETELHFKFHRNNKSTTNIGKNDNNCDYSYFSLCPGLWVGFHSYWPYWPSCLSFKLELNEVTMVQKHYSLWKMFRRTKHFQFWTTMMDLMDTWWILLERWMCDTKTFCQWGGCKSAEWSIILPV